MKAGWKTVKLGEVADIYNGNTIPDEEKRRLLALQNQGLPFIATKDVGFDGLIDYQNGINIPENEAVNFKVAKANAVLVCAEGGSAGRKIGHIDRDVHFGNKLFALNAKEAVNPRYLYHFCLSEDFRKKFKALMAGLIGGVSAAKFKLIEIPLPPLAEQKRIVALLDEAFAGIDEAMAKAEANLESQSDLLAGIAGQTIFSPASLSATKALGEIVSIARGGSPRPIQDYITDNPSGLNWIKIGDATASGKYIYKTEQKIRPEGLKKTRAVNPGDFLLSNSMSFGRPYILKTSGCIHDGWLVLSDIEKHLDQDYLYHVLGSRPVYAQFDKLAAGSTVRNLNTESVAKVVIPVPPISAQRDMAKKLDSIQMTMESLRSKTLEKIALIEELRKSLLAQAFAGELTA